MTSVKQCNILGLTRIIKASMRDTRTKANVRSYKPLLRHTIALFITLIAGTRNERMTTVRQFMKGLQRTVMARISAVRVKSVIQPRIAKRINRLVMTRIRHLRRVDVLAHRKTFKGALRAVAQRSRHGREQPHLRRCNQRSLRTVMQRQCQYNVSTIIIITILGAHGLIMKRIRQDRRVSELNVRSIKRLLRLIIHTERRLRVRVTRRMIMTVLFPVTKSNLCLIVIRMCLNRISALTGKIRNLSFIINTIRRNRLLRSTRMLMFKRLLRVIMSRVRGLRTITALTISSNLPITLRLLTTSTTITNGIRQLRFKRVNRRIRERYHRLETIMSFCVNRHDRVLPTPHLTFAVRKEILLSISGRILCNSKQINGMSLLRLNGTRRNA